MSKSTSIEEMSLAQLKETAVSLGMPKEDTELFTVKKLLISTIQVLRAKNADTKISLAEAAQETPQEKKEVDRRWLSKAEIMRDKLEKQRKIRFMIPTEGKEKPGVIEEVIIKGRKEQRIVSGAYEVVTLNGYKTFIPKGVMVDLPEQVVEELSQSKALTQSAGKELEIDRIDPETGKPVRDQLSQA